MVYICGVRHACLCMYVEARGQHLFLGREDMIFRSRACQLSRLGGLLASTVPSPEAEMKVPTMTLTLLFEGWESELRSLCLHSLSLNFSHCSDGTPDRK